jgi:hypothetical protein
MSVTPNYVPREYKTVNVMLIVKDAERALKFYNSAFGADITLKLEDPQGKIIHAEMKIDDTIIMLRNQSIAKVRKPLVVRELSFKFIPEMWKGFMKRRSMPGRQKSFLSNDNFMVIEQEE